MPVSNIPSTTQLPNTAATRATEARETAAGNGDKSVEAKESTPAQQREQVRQARNLEILQANLSVGSEPLALVYQAAIDAINEELQPTFGDNAIQRAQQEGLDVSPEATADRIVSMTTAFFSRFEEQYPNLDDEALVDRFIEVIGSGIERGFNEARDILDGLGVLEGDIATNIDKTFELVQQGLEEFRQRMLGDAPDAAVADTGLE